MMHILKIKSKNIKGVDLLTSEPCSDNYLMQLKRYLFEHRGRVSRVLQILGDSNETNYGGNQMYTAIKGSIVFIYDGYDDDPEKYGIKINRVDLIEIMRAWLEVNELGEIRGGIKEMALQRDEEHINMIVHYEDGSEFKKTFNYKCNEEELKALKEYYFEE